MLWPLFELGARRESSNPGYMCNANSIFGRPTSVHADQLRPCCAVKSPARGTLDFDGWQVDRNFHEDYLAIESDEARNCPAVAATAGTTDTQHR